MSWLQKDNRKFTNWFTCLCEFRERKFEKDIFLYLFPYYYCHFQYSHRTIASSESSVKYNHSHCDKLKVCNLSLRIFLHNVTLYYIFYFIESRNILILLSHKVYNFLPSVFIKVDQNLTLTFG